MGTRASPISCRGVSSRRPPVARPEDAGTYSASPAPEASRPAGVPPWRSTGSRAWSDQCAGQQLQRPVRPAGRGRGAGHRDQAGFIAGAELRRTGPGRFDERARQAVFDEMLLGPIHEVPTPMSAIRSSGTWASAARRICARLISRGPGAAAGQRLQPFFERQRHAIAYVHGYLGSTRSPRRSRPIHTYALLYREPPAEADSNGSFSGPRHDRRAGAARADQPRPTAAPDDQAGTGGR